MEDHTTGPWLEPAESNKLPYYLMIMCDNAIHVLRMSFLFEQTRGPTEWQFIVSSIRFTEAVLQTPFHTLWYAEDQCNRLLPQNRYLFTTRYGVTTDYRKFSTNNHVNLKSQILSNHASFALYVKGQSFGLWIFTKF